MSQFFSVIGLIVFVLVRLLQPVQTCQISVVVDQQVGIDCSGKNLTNQTCNDLEDVLTLVSTGQTMLGAYSDGCVEIFVHQGTYLISRALNFTQNVKLYGDENVTVKFLDNGTSLYNYVFFFSQSESVVLKGIRFEQSHGSIGLSSVVEARIEDCSFRNFHAGALDIHSSANVSVTGCLFEHNGPHSLQKPPLRGYAGGLSISIDSTPYPSPEIHIKNCTFRNNSNVPPANLFQTTSQLLQNLQFTGRGGALVLILFSSSPLNATIEDVLFEQNYAQSFGGGGYLYLDGQSSNFVVMKRMKFYGNNAMISSGAIAMNFGSESSTATILHTVQVLNSEFVGNAAPYGGAVYVYVPGLVSAVVFDNCTFSENRAVEFGSALAAISLEWFGNMLDTEPTHIKDCTFVSNTGGRGGTLSTAYFPLSFYGDNKFKYNRGRALVNVGSHWHIYGRVHCIGSNAQGLDGGAVFIVSLGQLQLYHGSDMSFDQNRGILGAAIVADVPNVVPEVYSKLLFNPLCFLLYQERNESPTLWNNVSISFHDNVALIGSAALINNLNLCSWVNLEEPYFNTSQVMRWSFLEYGDSNQNTAHSPADYDPEWYVQTPAQSLNIIAENLTAYPGSELRFGVQVQDELGRPTASVIRVSEKDDRSHFEFNPALLTVDTVQEPQLNTTFYILSSLGPNYEDDLLMESVLGPQFSASTRDILHLTVSRCPPGYVLAEAPLESMSGLYYTCQCDSGDRSIVACSGTSITLTEGLWGTLHSDSTNGNSLLTYPCPPRYCSCTLKAHSTFTVCAFTYDSESPDTQCSCSRKGKLCGVCRDETGVSALLNRCVTCHDASGLLIAALIVADVGVFVCFLLFARSFPSWVYPCVFYIQMLPYFAEHFPWTFEQISPYLYYVSSALSFYFVYDFCLFGDMSAVVSYTLRYLPLFIAVFTITPILISKRYYRKPKSPWHGLWWITLLLFSHVVHTSMTILQCPLLPDENGQSVSTWYINGTVKCFHGSHAPLGLLAVLVLIFIVFIIVLATIYTIGYLQNPNWLRKVARVLKEGFKEKYKWWAAVELGRRFILILSIVAFPGNEFPAIFVLMLLTTIFGFLQPFKDRGTNTLEIVLAINALVLLLSHNTNNTSDTLQVLPVNITAISQNFTSSGNKCQNDDGVVALTNFTWLLLPLYYFPLLLSTVIVIVWIGWRAIKWSYKIKEDSNASGNREIEDSEAGITIQSQKPITKSVVDINELEELENKGVVRAGTELPAKPSYKFRNLVFRISSSFSVK